MLNIAEGSDIVRKNFYITARGTVFEFSSLVSFLSAEGKLATEWKEEIGYHYEEISKMLYAMIRNPERK